MLLIGTNTAKNVTVRPLPKQVFENLNGMYMVEEGYTGDLGLSQGFSCSTNNRVICRISDGTGLVHSDVQGQTLIAPFLAVVNYGSLVSYIVFGLSLVPVTFDFSQRLAMKEDLNSHVAGSSGFER